MPHQQILLLALASLTLSGCLARAAVDVVTAPVKIVSKGVDLATTSQSESDEKRGRELRKREERLGQLERRKQKMRTRCEKGKDDACAEIPIIEDEMERLINEPY